MNNKEVYYFVGKCLALDQKPEVKKEIIDKINSESVDWEKFVVLCSNHLVLPVIYLKLKTHEILDCLPEELENHLREVHELNVDRNQTIIKQLEEVVKVLSQKGIHPIFLKGSAQLLDGVYSDYGERIMSDVDFLVSEKDYLPSAELLKEIGYKQVYETEDWVDISKAKHYPRLFREDCVANIEIHRIPVDAKYTKWFNFDLINEDKKEVSSLKGCYVPSDCNKIIHNFIHSQLSNEGHLTGGVSLREIYDLLLLARSCELDKAINTIKTKNKAKAYFAYVDEILGFDKSFYSQRNFSFRMLNVKSNYNLKSDNHKRKLHSIIFIGQRIFVGYIGLFLKLFYSKEKRNYFFKRISNKKWYGNHMKLYARFFKENK